MREIFTNWRWILLLVSILAHAVVIGYLRLPDARLQARTTEILITFNQPEPVESSPSTPSQLDLPPVSEVRELPQPVSEPIPDSDTAENNDFENPENTAVDESTDPGVDTSGEAEAGDNTDVATSSDSQHAGTGIIDESTNPDQNGTLEPELEIDIDALIAAYSETIKQRIRDMKSYPPISRRLRETGSVQIDFTVSSDGYLETITISGSSGHDRLDQAAIDAVRNASPFDPIPSEINVDRLPMSIVLVFELD